VARTGLGVGKFVVIMTISGHLMVVRAGFGVQLRLLCAVLTVIFASAMMFSLIAYDETVFC
jgi:hypothetical protein